MRTSAIRNSREAIARAQGRLKDKVQRGKRAGQLTRLCANYVPVFTTLSGQHATAAEVLETYRLRWQIELSFKPMKSIAQPGHLPKYDRRSRRAWLNGKLLLALLREKTDPHGTNRFPLGLTPAPSRAAAGANSNSLSTRS